MDMTGKNVVVGVTGGIAAYKAAELVRLLVKAGAHTRVAMTVNATRFVTPLTFEALSGQPVIQDMFAPETEAMGHIAWGQSADLVIIAPATANFIAKMAHGLGDDFLSTMVLAATAKILVCPAMNTRMFANQAVQDNLRLLKMRGHVVMEPASGDMACGTEGPGRLPEAETIVEQARIVLSDHDLNGLKILVTAGATVEPIDPVRYITNRSSGKMGFAVARAAGRRGAVVTLITGPTRLNPPLGVHTIAVQSTEDMKKAVFDYGADCDIIVKAAAVSDYRPKTFAGQKIKKTEDAFSIDLVRNPDILSELGCQKVDRPCLLVGFAAETEDLLENARTKLNKKNLDIIVANNVSREDAGFGSDTNLVKVLYRDGRTEEWPLMSKEAVADQLLDRIKALWDRKA